MTLLAAFPASTSYALLHGVTWEDYEKTLAEIGDGAVRVTYLDGSMEIMPPLPEHENEKKVIGRLVEEVTLEMDLPVRGFGSTTFRNERQQGGLEPDECFYVLSESKVRRMKRFDPRKHPPPDLAIEIDLTRGSVSRETIYARLGVPEIWRWSRAGIAVHVLGKNGRYRQIAASRLFPFLPMSKFVKFAQRMLDEEPNGVVREFRIWMRKIRRKTPRD